MSIPAYFPFRSVAVRDSYLAYYDSLAAKEWPVASVESPEDQIRSVSSSLSSDLRVAITDASTAEAFGNITCVPTLFLFDRSGKTVQVVYGAPPDLHERVGQALDSLAD